MTSRRETESRYPERYSIFVLSKKDFCELSENAKPIETCLAVTVLNVERMKEMLHEKDFRQKRFHEAG